MQLSYFTDNLYNCAVLVPAIIKEHKAYFEVKAFREYDPKWHKVMNPAHRKDRMVQKQTGGTCTDGTPEYSAQPEAVNRIAVPFQKLIVSRGSAFLTGGKVTLQSTPSDDTEQRVLDAVNKTWRNNKMQFRNNTIARKLMSETEVAEVWYSKATDDGVEMQCKIYSPSDGYNLIPVWDEYQDLIAFGLHYKNEVDGREVEYLDLYTKEERIKYRKTQGEWEEYDRIALPYGKIPVIYYGIPQSVWQDVQPLIERVETILSNFGDTVDYNGSPIIALRGKIEGFASKGETGKMIQLGGDNASIEYVTWDGAPEAIRLELETLTNLIYTMTQTPNISFEQMQGLGGLSGVAFDRVFLDAHLKAKDMQEGEYGEGIQRRLNFLVAACSEILNVKVDLEVTPIFSLFKIDDVSEKITTAMAANGGQAVWTLKQSVEYVGATDDVDATVAQLQGESDSAEPAV